MSTRPDRGGRLESRLSTLLRRALLQLEELHRAHLAPQGVSARQLAVLMFLDGREPESQQQAARHLGVDRTTMVGLLDALEAKALVTRHADAADRRRNVVELTDAGRTTLERATQASDEAEKQLLSGLDATEAAQLRELLGRVDGRPGAV